MRVSTVFFFAVVLVAATLTLYFMVELMGISPGGKVKVLSDFSANDASVVEELERKLAVVENSIKHNQELVADLQAKLTYMLKEVPTGKEEGPDASTAIKKGIITDDASVRTGTVKIVGTAEVQTFTPLAGATVDQCPVVDWSASKADVQMSDVYDLIPFDNPNGGVWKQGWNLTYSSTQWTELRPLQVFVVPHSHNDPGWIKTFEKYFEEQTKNIFDLMVKKIPGFPKRKFIWAEISYLDLWWQTASDEAKKIFKRLVKEGQLEIVTGGWVMPDEANANYYSMLDQLIEGHEWIKNHLGKNVISNNGYSIDPFGLSPTIAYIDKLMQFDAMLIQRGHYSVKKYLGQQKSLEFRWRQSWDQNSKTDIFCHMMPFYSYDVPHTCGPDPRICCQFDFKRLPGTGRINCPWNIPPRAISAANVQERAETLLDQYRKKAQLYKTNTLLVLLGDDFRYDTAAEWDQQYVNYEKLMRHIESHPEYNAKVQFGTLNDYFVAVKADAKRHGDSLPTLSGDFFTYADRDDHYWSGYYTSRPFYKLMERTLLARLRATEIVFALHVAKAEQHKHMTEMSLIDGKLAKLVRARRNLALFQHHDGIAGTAKTHVMQDYAMKMIGALDNCGQLLGRSLSYLLLNDQSKDGKPSPSKLHLRIDESFHTYDEPSKKQQLLVKVAGQYIVIFNSLGITRAERVSFLVNSPKVVVVELRSGGAVVSQINPLWNGRTESVSDTSFELTFVASVPALGVITYFVESSAVPSRTEDKSKAIPAAVIANVATYKEERRSYDKTGVFDIKTAKYPSSISLENDVVKVTCEGTTGYLKKVMYKGTNLVLDVALKFIKYGTTTKEDKSGAYLFLPDGDAADMKVTDEKGRATGPLLRYIDGPVMSELQVVTTEVMHIIRISRTAGVDAQSVEIENRVDVTRKRNYELAMHFSTGIRNENFVTDLNGFQMTRRKTLSKLPLQANYYPFGSAAFIEDADHRMTVVSRQPLGVASLQTGSLEIMLDRRLDQDDSRGLGQPMNDNIPSTPSFFRLFIESNRPIKESSTTFYSNQTYPSLSLSAHIGAFSLLHPLVVLSAENPTEWPQSVTGRGLGLKEDLPCDVHLLNLRTAVAVESDDGTIAAAVNGSSSGADLSGRSGPTALMMLHRVGVDCRRPAAGMKCSLSAGGKIEMKAVFKGLLSFPYVEEGSPSPLHKGALMPLGSLVQLDPMHIRAFRFPLI